MGHLSIEYIDLVACLGRSLLRQRQLGLQSLHPRVVQLLQLDQVTGRMRCREVVNEDR